jgi:hypothetical protein
MRDPSDILDLHGPNGWLQIFSIVVDQSKLAVKGRQHLRYAAGGHGFYGSGDGFVAVEQLHAFSAGILSLADGAIADSTLEASETGGLSLRLRPGPEIDRISIEGRIASSVYRTLDEKDGLCAWSAQFGFWVTREYLSAAIRKVTWVQHFTSQDIVKVP